MSADAPIRLEGRCLCGAVSIRVTCTEPPAVGVCHCRMCQRWSGALYASFGVETLEATGPVARFRSSPFSERAFCASCGAHLFMHDLADGGHEVMPGLFDAAQGFPLASEIYTDRALPGLALSGPHRRATAAEYEADHPHLEDPA